jgi:hypothetical protein
MDIKRLIDTNGDLTEIAKARDTGVGRALLKAAKTREEQLIDELVTTPRRSDNIAESMEFKLGMVSGLRFYKKLIEEVGKYVDGLKQQGESR